VVVDTTLDPSEIVFPITIRIYFTNEEIISAYVDQSTLRLYFWDETNLEWTLPSNSGVEPSDVPGYDGYVWADIYHLSVFAAMGNPKEPKVPVGGVWTPINKLELLAPYIGLASLITIAAISIVFVKYRKKKQT